MIEQPTTPQLNSAPIRRILRLLWRLLLVLILGAIAIVLAYFLGQRIGNDEWPLLITATGLGTYIAITLNEARHGFLLWIATAPFARFVHLDLELGAGIPNLTLTRIMTGVLAVLLLGQLAIRRRKLVRPSLADVLLVAFLVTATMSLSSSQLGLKSAVQSFFDLIGVPVAIYFIARYLITSQAEFEGAMRTLVIAGLYLSVLAMREQLTGQVWFYPEDRSIMYTASIRRVVGLLGNPAYIAVCIAMGVPWAWYFYFNTRKHRLLLLMIAGAMMAGVFFCMNRSGWVGLIAALGTMALFVPRFRRIFILMIIVGVIVAGVYWAFIITSTTVQERLTAEGPIEYRFQAWDVAINMIRDYPIFGLGYDNYRLYYRRYAWWDIYLRATPTPHNTYLWVILMAGFVCFVPFILFLARIIFSAMNIHRKARRLRDQVPYADLAGYFLASMVAIWVPALVMDILTGYYNTMLLFLIIGAFYGLVTGENWQGRLAGLSQFETPKQRIFVRS